MLDTGILNLLDSLRHLRSLQSYYDSESTFIRTSFTQNELETIDSFIQKELTLQTELLREKLQEEMQ